MAITKILNINSTDEGNPAEHLKNALEYIQNPDKTEKCQLVGGINCLPEMAYNQMMDTKQTYGKSGKRQAYHVIISFPPEETVTPDQARFVAEGFIKDILKNEYEVVYGIHTDKEHTHVHIIWNSVSLVTGKKYVSPKQNWKKNLQPATNKYCKELGLEIMPEEYAKNPVNMDKGRWEYEQSFKEYILNDAMTCLAYAGSLEHFIFLMKKLGYEFKCKDYLNVRLPGMKLYHRLDKLSENFTEELLPTILKYGYGAYFRRYQTKGGLFVRRANLTPMQKKYYAKMYRLRLIEKKGFQYHSAEMAKEIKRMQYLQEQYLFICDHNVSSVGDLFDIQRNAEKILADDNARQKEIYKERYLRKRKCKTSDALREYQIFHLESDKELQQIKESKKQAQYDLKFAKACLEEKLYTGYGYIDESEELNYAVADKVPEMYDFQKEEIDAEYQISHHVAEQRTEESYDGDLYEDQEKEEYEPVEEIIKDERVEGAVRSEVEYLWNDPEFRKELYGDEMEETKTTNSSDEELLDEYKVTADYVVDSGKVEDKADRNRENDAPSVELGSYVDISKPQTIGERAKEISNQILKHYHSYDNLSAANKARIFKFRIDDNKYNIDLHKLVLENLGIDMMGADRFDDYQEIYEETLKRAESREVKRQDEEQMRSNGRVR